MTRTSRICILGFAATLVTFSAVPIAAEVIFNFNVDNNSAREAVHFEAPTGWKRSDSKIKHVFFFATGGKATCSVLFGYPETRFKSDDYFEALWTTLISTKEPLAIEGPKWSGPSYDKQTTWIMRTATVGDNNLTRALYVADSRSSQIYAIYDCKDTDFDNENRDLVLQALVNIRFERVASPAASVANPANCRFRGDHVAALRWCESQCVRSPLPDRTGSFSVVDSYAICRGDAYSCALKNSQC
jgi:hypothetical protein